SLTQLPSFFFTTPATTELYPLSLHDALPISTTSALNSRPSTRPTPTTQTASASAAVRAAASAQSSARAAAPARWADRCIDLNKRSEEHTSELQSRFDLVCRLLLEKKKHVTNR